MSVIIETSLGTLTIDLFVDECPIASKNFLKLCKTKYYNNCIFHNIQKDYLVQTGDPEGTGRGGQSIYGQLLGEQANYFKDEFHPKLRHTSVGMVSMANKGRDQNGSQFFITTAEGLDSFDDRFTLFGQVQEGSETLAKINNTITDNNGKPLQVVRIHHTIIIWDPFPDPDGLVVPQNSPPPVLDAPKGILPEGVDITIDNELTREELEKRQELLEKQQARSRAQILTELGDIPDADIKPPDDVLFVCRLNPVTTEEDLNTIFCRFGEIEDCEIIRDKLTKESLCYAFIKYAEEESAIEAYFKMNKVSIDERRIHVDFSQSVAKVDWKGAGGWKQFFAERAAEMNPGSGRGGGGGGEGRGGARRIQPSQREEPYRKPLERDYKEGERRDQQRCPRDQRDQRGLRDQRDQRDQKDRRDQRDPRDQRDQRNQRDQKDHRDHRDQKDNRGRDQRDNRDRDGKDNRDQRDQRDKRDQRDQRDQRDRRDRDQRDSRDQRDHKNDKDDMAKEPQRDGDRVRDQRDQREDRGRQQRDRR